MKKTIDCVDMPITAVLQNFLTSEGVDNDLQIDVDSEGSHVITYIDIDKRKYGLRLRANEKIEVFQVFIESPLKVPTDRIAEMCKIVNLINMGSPLGALFCMEGSDGYILQHRTGLLVNIGMFGGSQINDMMMVGADLFSCFGELLTTVSATKTSAEEAWSKFLSEQQEQVDQPAEEGQRPDDIEYKAAGISYGEIGQ